MEIARNRSSWWCWLTGGMEWEEKEGEVEIVGLTKVSKNRLKKSVDRGLEWV